MKRIGFVLCLAGALALLAPFAARAEANLDTMLLWQVCDDEPPSVYDPGDGTYKYITDLGGVNGAKLRVEGGGYLDIYNSKGTTMFPNAILTIDPDNLSQLGLAGPVWSSLGEYADAAYAFTVELGHWENDEWTVMATSKTTTYAELLAGGWTSSNMNAYPREGPWSPTFTVTSVPEPTSGLLVLIGGALLALRRRRPAGVGRATRSVAPTKGGCAGLVGRTLRVRRNRAA